MRKDYSKGYLKNNRSSSLSVRISAFISALLLALLCGLFYNAWKYEIERIEQETGGWQSRIMGELDEEDMISIKNYAGVRDAVMHELEDDTQKTAADIYFDDMRSVFTDTPRIAKQAGVSPDQTEYNYELLAMYLIRGPGDTAPRLLFPMYLLVVVTASVSLIIIIHNAFAVSMNARIHQFGIFSSIGASPKQIRTCLLQEAAALCALPVIAGNLAGLAGSMGVLHLVNVLLGEGITGRHRAVFGCHPMLAALILSLTVLTIWISAWLPARRLSRLTPLEAVRNTGELQLNKKKNSYLLTLLWGAEGELAGNALKAQKKALRTASFSLIASFMAFSVMQCFFSLSRISTEETYFKRYQGIWDIMVTLQDTGADTFDKTKEVQELAGVQTAIVYQKAAAKRILTEEELSGEMKTFGGFLHASDKYVTKQDNGWMINVPLVILDDHSFADYCRQTGVSPRLDGAVILNRIRNVTNPDFRHPQFLPYIKEKSDKSVLTAPGNGKTDVQIPVLAYTQKMPALREEYASDDYYELVHFIPVSLWKKIKEKTGGAQADSLICIRGRENVTLDELLMLEDEIESLISKTYTAEYENRIQEYESNNKMIQGAEAVLGGFCILLAVIGMGSVFSNTFGFVNQRKREFARYMSAGMTLKQLRNMFCIEALVIAARPVLTGLPLVIIAAGYMLKASYLELEVFMEQAPLLPVLAFVLAVWGFIALAYYLAWRSVRTISIAEVLKDDTMM